MAVTVAGMALQETRLAEQDGQTLRITGKHGWQRYPVAAIQAVHDNVIALDGRTVPVVFGDKAQLSGFYRVAAASSSLTRYANGAVEHALWSLSLERVGSSRDVEIESRVPTVGRLTDHAVSPVFWHAPAVGATSYWTGSTVPSGTVTRDSMDGPVVVHTGIPSGIAPRWTVPVADYLGGSVRLLVAGQRRLGEFTPDAAVWEVNNGLVRLTSPGSDGAIGLACWDGAAWRSERAYRFTAAGGLLSSQPETTVLRNDPEEVAVRLSYAMSVGRVTADLSLRRGSRFITGVLKQHSAGTLSVRPVPDIAGSDAVTGGYLHPADSDGNRTFLGSARTPIYSTVGQVYRSGVTQLDFFSGHEVGATPAAGDAYADLLGQYLGSSGERVRVVRR